LKVIFPNTQKRYLTPKDNFKKSLNGAVIWKTGFGCGNS